MKQKKKNNSNFKREVSSKAKAYPVTSRNKIGRNETCPCGSKKKYKLCCLKKKNYVKNFIK